MRRICYVTGTRADYGLMQATLLQIAAMPSVDLSVVVTGMHLSESHGMTVNEIHATGFRIAVKVPVLLKPATGATMARNIGTMVTAFTDAFEAERPELVLLLGDRGEMLAGALAAIHLNIPVGHVHGGELSGTVDEPVRHAISKLSHIHFTSTVSARDRLVRMGELEANVHVTGAPGLDGLLDAPRAGRIEVAARYDLDASRPIALMVFHPVLQEADRAEADARAIMSALGEAGMQTIALMPNSDAGSYGVRQVLEDAMGTRGVSIHTHLARPHFLDAMSCVDVMVGNSSAGIIESASFGTPVINIGRRQNLRDRNANVIDVAAADAGLTTILKAIILKGRCSAFNIYGDGNAGLRIANLISSYDLSPVLLMKLNGY